MEHDVEFVPTLLDRLVPSRQHSGEIGSKYRSDAEEFSASIARDLHALLNTRREEFLVPPAFEQTATSIFNFGVPDFTKCGSLRSTADQAKLCKWIEEAIRTFEPRLRNITVRVLDSENITSVLRFRVEAKADIFADRLSFDMGLKRDSGELAVAES
jgi:type VI secretion system lysozyme-like protein